MSSQDESDARLHIQVNDSSGDHISVAFKKFNSVMKDDLRIAHYLIWKRMSTRIPGYRVSQARPISNKSAQIPCYMNAV